MSNAPVIGRKGSEDNLASADRDLRDSFTGGRSDRVREGYHVILDRDPQKV